MRTMQTLTENREKKEDAIISFYKFFWFRKKIE